MSRAEKLARRIEVENRDTKNDKKTNSFSGKKKIKILSITTIGLLLPFLCLYLSSMSSSFSTYIMTIIPSFLTLYYFIKLHKSNKNIPFFGLLMFKNYWWMTLVLLVTTFISLNEVITYFIIFFVIGVENSSMLRKIKSSDEKNSHIFHEKVNLYE